MKRALLLLVLVLPVTAGDIPRFFTGSVAVAVSGAIADTASTRQNMVAGGFVEVNPVYGSYLSKEEAVIRLAIIGGGIVAQALLLRKMPPRRRARWSKRFAALNLTCGGLAWGAAVHNVAIR